MDEWFSELDARRELQAGIVQDLLDVGFVVIPGPVAADRFARFSEAYDSAVALAVSDDVSIGSSFEWTSYSRGCIFHRAI